MPTAVDHVGTAFARAYLWHDVLTSLATGLSIAVGFVGVAIAGVVILRAVKA